MNDLLESYLESACEYSMQAFAVLLAFMLVEVGLAIAFAVVSVDAMIGMAKMAVRSFKHES